MSYIEQSNSQTAPKVKVNHRVKTPDTGCEFYVSRCEHTRLLLLTLCFGAAQVMPASRDSKH